MLKRLFFVFAVLVLGSSQAWAQPHIKPILRFKEPVIQCAVGDTFTMTLVVENMPPIAGMSEFHPEFDWDCSKFTWIASRRGADMPAYFNLRSHVVSCDSITGDRTSEIEELWVAGGGICAQDWQGGEALEMDLVKLTAGADTIRWWSTEANYPGSSTSDNWIRCCVTGAQNNCPSCNTFVWPFSAASVGCANTLRVGQDLIVTTSPVAFTDSVLDIVQNDCRWCHKHEPLPAGIPFTTTFALSDHVPKMWFAVDQGAVPYIQKLAASSVDTLENWVDDAGYLTPRTLRAGFFGWNQAAFVPHGAPPEGWFFTVEDGWIDGAYVNNGVSDHRWTVEPSFTDSYGVSRTDVLKLTQTRTTDADSFADDANSNVYGILGNFQRHNGYFYNYTIEGDVWGHHSARNIGIPFLIGSLEPPGRANREYVKLVIDSLGVFLRSTPSKGEQEEPPYTGGDSLLVGNISKTVSLPQNLWASDQWLHVKITTARVTTGDTLGTVISATVSRAVNNQVVADLYGVAIDDTTMSGAWGVSKYGTGTVRWAGFSVYAQIDTVNAGVPDEPLPHQRRQKPNEVANPTDDEDSGYGGP